MAADIAADAAAGTSPTLTSSASGMTWVRHVVITAEMHAAVMLLPEAYVRYVLNDYYQDMIGSMSLGARAVTGFLVLEDTWMVPMRLPDVSEAEQIDAAKQLGARLWKMPASSAGGSTRGDVLECMRAAPKPWKDMLTYKVKGGVTPVIANGKLYSFGYYDDPKDRTDVQEALSCLDPETGELVWEYRFSDFSSDVVYNRYAVGSPIVDAETGNV